MSTPTLDEKKHLQGKSSYSKKHRWLMGVIFGLAFAFGIATNPGAFVESVKRIPSAFSVMVTWLVFTGGVVWFLVDMAAKKLLGKSLRELIADQDKTFERNLVVAMVIAIPIVMLVAR